MRIPEEFLNYIWKFKRFNYSELQLTSGEKLTILNSGSLNTNAGPDFFNGQIRIENTIWAGNIEIHYKSSDWFLHQHEKDEIYSKIILHIVWENDREILDQNGTPIPTLELKGRISKSLIDKYNDLKEGQRWIPCEDEIKSIDQTIKLQEINRALAERLEIKSNRIDQLLQLNKNDWEATLYQLLAKYFGFKINAIPFELLATSTPYSVVKKTRNNAIQLSALLYGQAGFLNDNFQDKYPKELKKEYEYLKKKFQLTPLNKSLWKFMRMRPSNFPTIRIDQFSKLFSSHQNLFQGLLEAKSIETLKLRFQLKGSPYWESHYQFDKLSKTNTARKIGNASIDIVIINAVVPLLFNYADKTGNELLKERTIHFLEDIKPEKNHITNKWSSFNMPVHSAYESQALLQLKTTHCDIKNCLNCTIGNAILKKTKT